VTAVVLKQAATGKPDEEFWAVVGPGKGPAEPTARSKEEFEMKLAVMGLELTGRELAWPKTGLPLGLRIDCDARAFEVREAGGGSRRSRPGLRRCIGRP
jgi:hypothetical protein